MPSKCWCQEIVEITSPWHFPRHFKSGQSPNALFLCSKSWHIAAVTFIKSYFLSLYTMLQLKNTNFILTQKQAYTYKITKLENQIKRWLWRGLSLEGKIIITKTFGMSQLIYFLQCCVIHPEDIIRVDRISFLWNKKLDGKCPDRIPSAVFFFAKTLSWQFFSHRYLYKNRYKCVESQTCYEKYHKKQKNKKIHLY